MNAFDKIKLERIHSNALGEVQSTETTNVPSETATYVTVFDVPSEGVQATNVDIQPPSFQQEEQKPHEDVPIPYGYNQTSEPFFSSESKKNFVRLILYVIGYLAVMAFYLGTIWVVCANLGSDSSMTYAGVMGGLFVNLLLGLVLGCAFTKDNFFALPSLFCAIWASLFIVALGVPLAQGLEGVYYYDGIKDTRVTSVARIPVSAPYDVYTAPDGEFLSSKAYYRSYTFKRGKTTLRMNMYAVPMVPSVAAWGNRTDYPLWVVQKNLGSAMSYADVFTNWVFNPKVLSRPECSRDTQCDQYITTVSLARTKYNSTSPSIDNVVIMQYGDIRDSAGYYKTQFLACIILFIIFAACTCMAGVVAVFKCED